MITNKPLAAQLVPFSAHELVTVSQSQAEKEHIFHAPDIMLSPSAIATDSSSNMNIIIIIIMLSHLTADAHVMRPNLSTEYKLEDWRFSNSG
jgi:hypothetical protein